MKNVYDFFRAPVFEDEEKNRQAYLLNIILWTLVFVPVPYLAYVLTTLPEFSTRAWVQTLFGEGINIFLLYLLRRGYVQTAGLIQLLAFWLFFTVTAYTGYGVQDEAYIIGYPLTILIGGLILGSRFAAPITILSLVSGLGMLIAYYNGIIPVIHAQPPQLTWVISLALFPVIATLQYLTIRTLQDALQRAHKSEERYRLISAVSSDYAFESVMESDDKARTVWMAGAFEKMTGYTPEEYISSGGWYGHIHPDDLVQDARDMEKLINNEDVQGSEIRTFTKNGEIRWERIFAHPIWDHKENRLSGIIGAVQDITEQKIAEQKVQETLLQQTAILNNIPDMAWLKDLDCRYIAVNEEFLRVSGRKEEEIIGKTDLEIWELPFAEYYRNDDMDVIKSGKRKTIEEKQRDFAGGEYWVETTKTPIRGKDGNVIGTTGISRSISDRKRAELERERLIAELEAKNAELERFTYTVSHDLKSPLVTINGFLGYLEKDALSGDQKNFIRDLGRIRQAVEKMHELLNDLLELSRIGRMVNEPVELGFATIIADALALLEGPISAKKAIIEFADEGLHIYGDRVRLTEVVQNLVENAIKFMGSQPQPKVKIGSLGSETGQPFFFVQDNGIGIEPQYQDRIFGLFNKLDTNTEGTGIGLALVKRIIEVHNGRIWLESQPGRGSTFYFTLPIAR